jgi:hypothetical protein
MARARDRDGSIPGCAALEDSATHPVLGHTGYDWRKAEAKLNALPQFVTTIDGVDIQFVHVKSRHPNAMPLIMTHEPRSITSEFGRQWTRVEPFGQADWHMLYEPNRVVIETQAGEVVAQQDNPRETFAGHAWETPWTPLQLAYFNGYAMWTYYNLPFLLGEPAVEATEIPSIADGDSVLRGLRVRFPQEIHSHSPEQSLQKTRSSRRCCARHRQHGSPTPTRGDIETRSIAWS